MKEVKSYQTEDNRLFTDKIEATKHEFTLEIKGFMQTKNKLPINGINSMTVQQVADTVSRNFDEFIELIKTYRRKLSVQNRGPYKRRKKTVTPELTANAA